MTATPSPLPDHYATVVRRLLRYGMVMIVVGLLSGILFQESAKKLTYEDVEPGLRLEAVIHLALVHGHIFVTGVLMPLGIAGALLLARKVGGAELTTRSLRWLTWYLVLAAVDATFFGGYVWVRRVVYGIAHAGMGISVGIFAVALFRSLRAPR